MMPYRASHGLLALAVVSLLGCSGGGSSPDPGPTFAEAGQLGTGGSELGSGGRAATGGGSGAGATGGNVGSGGTAVGGSTGAGATGGDIGAGGDLASGGTSGAVGVGGQLATGGQSGTGGSAGDTGGAADTGGQLAIGGEGGSGGATGGSGGATGGSGGATGGSGGVTGGSGGATGGSGGSSGDCVAADLVPANGVIGMEWPELPDATGYRIYWSTTAGVNTSSQSVDVDAPAYLHEGLDNATTYHYSVAALTPSGETDLCYEVSATPGGEWVLRWLGTGVFDDLLTGNPVPRVPIADRLHILLFPEGYLQAELGDFESDIADWIDQVFALDVYDAFRQAFVIWYLPRASSTHIGGGDTAFQVPVQSSGGTWVTSTIAYDGETASRAWAAIDLFNYPPTDFSGGGLGTVRKLTAAFLIYDPDRGRAGVSGRALSLRNPASSAQRLSSAFGVDHHHEFTHAFSAVYDEYMEEDFNGQQWPTDGTSNVVNASACSEVPWSHLLAGAGIHDTAELVGAFGRSHIGFHSEFLCLMNGGHDNPTYYGDNWLRVDRMCNYCRELTAFRVFQRSGIIDDFDTWVASYRNGFFDTYGFFVPSPVPQQNSSGTEYYEACTSLLAASQSLPGGASEVFSRPRVPRGAPLQIGCVQLDPEDVYDE
jgi:hypothetical protein